MKLKKLHSNREIAINMAKYRVDWDAPCRSKFQFQVKQWLKQYWRFHVCLEEFIIPGSRLAVDFVNLTRRVLIEVNGSQHDKFNKHFHRNNRANFIRQITRDQCKRDWAEANGFLFVEIQPEDLPLTEKFFIEKYNLQIS